MGKVSHSSGCRGQGESRGQAQQHSFPDFIGPAEHAAGSPGETNEDLDDAKAPSKSLLQSKLDQIEENRPEVEDLCEVTSVDDAEVDILNSNLDKQGQLRITKGTAKIKPPAASEELRLRHRRIGLAWEMASQRHSGRTWLQGATAEAYRKLSSYVLGPAVSEIGSSTEKGAAFNPPWSLVLHCEYQVRKLAYKLVLKESIGIGEALKKAMADAECRQRHFMDRLTLEQKVVPSFPFGHSTTDKRKYEGKGRQDKAAKDRPRKAGQEESCHGLLGHEQPGS